MVAFNSPLQGLARAQASFDRAAGAIAWTSIASTPENSQDQVSLSDQMVALIEARNSFEANLGTLKTADKMQKALLSLLG